MLYIPDIIPEPDPADGLISRVCMAKYLLGLMAKDYSQSYNFVSWSDDLPYLLWDAVHGKEVAGSFGSVSLPPEQRKLLLELATVADGWWIHFPDFTDSGASFISMEQWRIHLKTRIQS